MRLRKILSYDGKSGRIAWERIILSVGFLMIALALMGLLDSIPFDPNPKPDQYWAVKGGIGLVLSIIGFIWIKTKHS